MFQTSKCLRCYEPIAQGFYHEQCSMVLFGLRIPPVLDTTSEEIEKKAKEFLNHRFTVTGVQKKLSLQLENKETPRLTIVGSLGGSYILKPPSKEYEQMPENEDLSMRLAQIYGIKTAEHGLIPMKDGALAYVTKRFDRDKKKKISVEDLCQLSETQTENKYRLSSEKVGKVIRKFSSFPGDDALRFFELLLYSYVIGNNDMHLKNFSMITDNQDKIILSPAYDLLAVRLLISQKDDPEDMALTINGKKNKLKRSDWNSLAENLQIPENVCAKTISKLQKCEDSFKELIAKSFLQEDQKKQLLEIIHKQMKRLDTN